MLSMITISDDIYARMHFHTISICTNGMTIVMCLCMLLAAICAVCYWLDIHQLWCASLWILKIMSLHLPTYNIAGLVSA